MAKTSSEKSTTKKIQEITCSCCGDRKKKTEFYSSQSKVFEAIGKLCICKDCVISVFNYYKEKYKGDEQAAIYRMCELLNLYYDKKLIEGSYKDLEKRGNEKDSSVMKFYMKNVVMPQYKGKTFEDRDIKVIHAKEIMYENELEDTTLNKEEQKSKDECIRLLGYDPFNGFDMTDQKYLYNNLIQYLDEDTIEDNYKVSVIIQIVINNNQSKKANTVINQLSKDPLDMIKNSKDILALTDMTTKWNQQNDKLSKENNIALKHRGDSGNSKSTLGGKMKTYREYGFVQVSPNYFDMKTCEAMLKCAKISNKAIYDQLSPDENFVEEMVLEQRELIQELQDNELKLKEEKRILAVKNAELEKQLKKSNKRM